MSVPTDPQPSPATDISSMARSLGRYLDRLPPGEYVLQVGKGDEGWTVAVKQEMPLRYMNLERPGSDDNT